MPSAPLRPCAHPGCPALVAAGYCAKHQRAQLAKRREKKVDKFYVSPMWRKVRNRYWKRHPLCEHCLVKGIERQADMVDHIVEIRAGGARLDPGNLQSLCWGCHAAKTAREQKNKNLIP